MPRRNTNARPTFSGEQTKGLHRLPFNNGLTKKHNPFRMNPAPAPAPRAQGAGPADAEPAERDHA